MLIIINMPVQNYVPNNTKIPKAKTIINKQRNRKQHQKFIGPWQIKKIHKERWKEDRLQEKGRRGKQRERTSSKDDRIKLKT